MTRNRSLASWAHFVGAMATVCAWGLAFSVAPAIAASVPVGSSALIDTLHYSDTFTLTTHGGLASRPEGVFPVVAPGLNVESAYGNPAVAWSVNKWSLNTDASPFPGVPAYPGNSGGGSNTGITQSGLFGGVVDFGIEYGLSDSYVVQFDVVQTSDRVDITSSPVRDTAFGGQDIAGQRSLTVFFRGDNRSNSAYPSIGIYSPYAQETDSGLALGGTGVSVGQWANYAVRFDRGSNEIEIYVNQVSLGSLDLSTFAGGIYADWSHAAVSVGGFDFGGSSILWTDNFQVGAVVPEANSCVLAGMALLAVVGVKLRK